MLSISLVDRNLQISAEEVSCHTYLLTIDADTSLHFSRFYYHSFSVNVKIPFRTNVKVKKKTQKIS